MPKDPSDRDALAADTVAKTRMTELRARIEAARNEVANAEQELAARKGFLVTLISGDGVEVMRDLELKEYEFEDGATLSREMEFFVGLTEANEPEAFAWLKKNGHGALLKATATVEFGAKEAHLAEVLQAFCDRTMPAHEIEVNYGNPPAAIVSAIEAFVKETFPEHKLTVKEKINGNTLRAFLMKKHRAGEALPACFGVYAPQIASLQLPKKSAGNAF